MADARVIPANDRVALKGFARDGQRDVSAQHALIRTPVADLRAAPDGARNRQLLFGERFDVLERHEGWAFGVAARDGYVGYVSERALGPALTPTHRISVRATHLFPHDDFKAEATASLAFGSKVSVIDERRKFVEIEGGHFVPKAHIRPIERPFSDPVTIAQIFFGTPYLWGGNSSFGIDCSGLVQAALLACDLACPGDSDQQLALGASAAGPYARGDLLFWRGHVAICVDSEVLLHATAHYMAVQYEPIVRAIARLEAQGDGAVIAHRRL